MSPNNPKHTIVPNSYINNSSSNESPFYGLNFYGVILNSGAFHTFGYFSNGEDLCRIS